MERVQRAPGRAVSTPGADVVDALAEVRTRQPREVELSKVTLN